MPVYLLQEIEHDQQCLSFAIIVFKCVDILLFYTMQAFSNRSSALEYKEFVIQKGKKKDKYTLKPFFKERCNEETSFNIAPQEQ